MDRRDGSAHDLEVVRENFGDLSCAEFCEFLEEVCAQIRTDLSAIDSPDVSLRAAALHRLAGSAPSLGCLRLGVLARVAMADSSADLEPIRRAGLDALAWLEALMNEERFLLKESQE